jgi:hypothetical protein
MIENEDKLSIKGINDKYKYHTKQKQINDIVSYLD